MPSTLSMGAIFLVFGLLWLVFRSRSGRSQTEPKDPFARAPSRTGSSPRSPRSPRSPKSPTASKRRRKSSIFNLQDLRSAIVGLVVVDTRTGSKVRARRILQEAVDQDQWMVAYNKGPFVLRIGDKSIRFGMMRSDEFHLVLSHRWKPVIHTDAGPVPVPMLNASYEQPVWIDFLNHFHEPGHFQRVLKGMGSLFADKECRALYFEDTDFSQQVEAASRTWMWGELSLGQQAQTYNSVHTMWLHHVVAVGERDCLMSLAEIAVLVLHCALLSDLRQRFEPSGGATPGGGFVGWLKRSALLWFVRSGAASLPAPPALSDKVLRGGTLRAVLQALLGERLGRPEETADLVRALCSEVEADTGPARSEQLWVAALTLNRIGHVLALTLDHVVTARRSSEETTLAPLRLLRKLFRTLTWLMGERQLSQQLSDLAVAALESDCHSNALSAALENLSNRRLQNDSDRLIASFGILCAQKSLPCDFPAVARLVQEASDLSVRCLPRIDSCGLGQLACKRVHVRLQGDLSGSRKPRVAVPCYLATGMPLVAGEWLSVELSGLELQDSFVLAVGRSLYAILRRRNGMGELREYTMLDDVVVHLTLWMDCGVLLSVGDPSTRSAARGHPLTVHRDDFREWYSQLEDVPPPDLAATRR